jgi:medium-chain acyl-[acyl-carrier-protein] hydrolase
VSAQAISWLRPANPAPGAVLRLFCCAHAGGGAAAFNAWPRLLPPEYEVIKVQLPGREDNWQRPAARAIGELVPHLCAEVAPLLDRPFAFYGHSMGAIVMFDLARELRRQGRALPLVLFVSGRRAPQLPLSHVPLFSLPDDELIAQMHVMGASALHLFDKPRWREHFFPTMRADLEVSDTYRYQPEPPLACPIHAFGGADDATVKPWEWREWGEQTGAEFSGRVLSGSHFFDKAGQAVLLQHIAEALARHVRQEGPRKELHETA